MLRALFPFLLCLSALPALADTATPAPAPDPAIPTFADDTATSGLTHSFTGEWEFMVGGGAAVFDCSGDGKPEVFVAGGTAPSALFLNQSPVGGALSFARGPDDLSLDKVSGAYPLDIDSDGIMDLALLRVGEDVLMRGTGDCHFTRANEAWGFDGLDLWSTAFAATWERGSTWPTLAIGTYIDRTQEAFPWGSCTPNHLYRPASSGTGFAPALPLEPSFCALSILFTDWDRKGTPDLRVSNDREYYKGGQEQMWRLEPGQPPVAFTDKDGWQRLRIWGMGIADQDLNFDGYPEYFLTSMADNKLQTLAEIPAEGHPKPKFADVAFKRGVTAHRPYTGDDPRPSTAWHADFGDVNNDGLPDLLVIKGNVWEMPDFATKDPNNLLLQRSDGTFFEAGAASGTASFRQGRGGALVDLNLDGLLDILVVNRNEPTEVFRNTGGMTGHWLSLRPAQDGANRDAIGAWLQIKRSDGRLLQRELTLGGGHAGDQLGWWHVGLGDQAEAQVRVIWPDGTEGPWQNLAADGFYILPRDGNPEPFKP